MIILYILGGILIYLTLSISYGAYVFFYEKNSAEKLEKQIDTMDYWVDKVFNFLNPTHSTTMNTWQLGAVIFFMLVFSGPTARFFKDMN